MPTPSEQVISFNGRKFKIHRVPYSGVAATFDTDQSATGVSVIEPVSGAPSVSLGTAASGVKTVTVATGPTVDGAAVTVVVVHGASISTSKL